MVRLYTDARMLRHTPPAGHPESPDRLRAITAMLDRQGLAMACLRGFVREATDEELLRVHNQELLLQIQNCETAGGGPLDPDTWVAPGSQLAARLAAGAAAEAAAQVIAGSDRIAFCAVRPPGHHANADTAMGFCLFNAAAVAAGEALSRGLERVLIVDWDVHHGNGTQDIFYTDPRVGFLSIHRYPFYPGTGAITETGAGDGLGFTRNVPIRFGTPRADYHALFRRALHDMAERIRPELVIISAGFDAHHADPVGSLGLETEDFATLTEEVLGVARTHADGRLVSILEGGYNIQALAESVAVHLQALGVHPVHEMGPH